MPNLFTRLKGHLDDDRGGRFLAILLQQAMVDSPGFARRLIPALPANIASMIRSGDADIAIEWTFRPTPDARPKFADIAITQGDKVLALVEIKYRDHANPGSHAQLEDYLSFITRNDETQFVYLTQFHPPALATRRLSARGLKGRARRMSYRDLYGALHGDNHQTIRWLAQFLTEEAIVYQEDKIDRADLLYLMIHGLYFSHHHGFGRTASPSRAKSAFALFDRLRANCSALADWLKDCCPNLFSQRFTPRFGFDPCFSTAFVRSQLKAAEREDQVRFSRHARSGGEFWIYQSGTLDSGDGQWLGVDIGYSFEVDSEEKTVTGYLNFGTYGRWVPDEYIACFRSFRIDRAQPEDAVKRILAKLATSVLDDTLDSSRGMPARQRKILTGLRMRIVEQA